MSATPYPDLNAVLAELVASQRAALGAAFVGAYLQGSFAVGDFDEHSDVDFVTVVETELGAEQVDALRRMHPRVYALPCPWAQHLEGSYFPRALVRDYTRAGEPLWYLDHGSVVLERSDHCNTALVRWVLRQHGVRLAGPEPASLVEAVPVAVLRSETAATIARYGAAVLERPAEYANRFYQTYLVLNFARMLHDLHAGRPGSKRAGADWAKATLGPSWWGLIDRAWAGRPDPARSVREPADPADFASTLAFLRRIMAESERYVVETGLGERAALAYPGSGSAGAGRTDRAAPGRGSMSNRSTIEVENVNVPGRTSRVNARKYHAMRGALLTVLPPGPPGLSQAEMGAAVLPYLPEDLWPGGAKAMWWVKTVQLDLEAKRLVARDRSAKPTRWYRCA